MYFVQLLIILNHFQNVLTSQKLESWKNMSKIVFSEYFNNQELFMKRRNLLAYSKLGKISTLSFIHISRTGGLSFNKLLLDNRGIASRDGPRMADCIVPRSAYGNDTLPLSSRFDFPHCEILSSIWPLPTVQVSVPLLFLFLLFFSFCAIGKTKLQERGCVHHHFAGSCIKSHVSMEK